MDMSDESLRLFKQVLFDRLLPAVKSGEGMLLDAAEARALAEGMTVVGNFLGPDRS